MSNRAILMGRGAVAGGAATLCMSMAMLLSKRAGIVREIPPRLLARGALNALGETRPRSATVSMIAAAMHLSFGLLGGAAFAGCARLRSPRVLPGMVYGLGLWFLGYKVIVPKFGLMPRQERDCPGLTGVNVAAHLVFGAVLGACLDRIEKAAHIKHEYVS